MTMILMHSGDTKEFTITVVDAADAEVDITDAISIKFGLAKSAHSASALVSKSLGDGIEKTNPQVGEFAVTLEPADTEDLPGGVYYFEAEVMFEPDVTGTIISGDVLISPSLIRAASAS
jgi:hypothetical protein